MKNNIKYKHLIATFDGKQLLNISPIDGYNTNQIDDYIEFLQLILNHLDLAEPNYDENAEHMQKDWLQSCNAFVDKFISLHPHWSFDEGDLLIASTEDKYIRKFVYPTDIIAIRNSWNRYVTFYNETDEQDFINDYIS